MRFCRYMQDKKIKNKLNIFVFSFNILPVKCSKYKYKTSHVLGPFYSFKQNVERKLITFEFHRKSVTC